jgi:hypothetical protein
MRFIVALYCLLIGSTYCNAQEIRGVVADRVTDTLARKYKKPLIHRSENDKALTAEEIKRMPKCGPTDLVALPPGVYDNKRINRTTFLGIITDSKGEPITNASISVKKKGTLIGGTIADIDGRYCVTVVDTGHFELTVSYIGYETTIISKIFAKEKDTVRINVALSPSEEHAYMRPIICIWLPSMLDYYSSSYKITKTQMRGMNVGFSGVIDSNHNKRKDISYHYRPAKADTLVNQINYSDTALYVIDGQVYKGSKGIAAYSYISRPDYNRVSFRRFFDRHRYKRDQRLIAKARKQSK